MKRNALRANVVLLAEDWRWPSLWRRVYGLRRGSAVVEEMAVASASFSLVCNLLASLNLLEKICPTAEGLKRAVVGVHDSDFQQIQGGQQIGILKGRGQVLT